MYTATRPTLPLPVFGILAMPVAAATIALATGRRHGLPADRHPHATAPQRLRLPTRDVGADGIVDLGHAGSALICTASAVNFALRTEAEQEALIAVFARFLNALDAPVQIVARAERAELTETIDRPPRTTRQELRGGSMRRLDGSAGFADYVA